MALLKNIVALGFVASGMAAAPQGAHAQEPVFSMEYAPGTMVAGQSSILTYTIDNTANAAAVSGVGFSDAVITDATIGGGTASHTCDGPVTLTAPSGGTSVSFSGATLAAGAFCTVDVPILQTTPGVYNDTSNQLTTDTGTAPAASATLTVTPVEPVFSLAFAESTIFTGDVVRLTFTIDNSGATSSVLGASFSEDLPAGLVLASPHNASTSCSNTNFSGTSLSPSLSFAATSTSAMTVGAGASCTLGVDVLANTAGSYSVTPTDLASNFGGFSMTSAAGTAPITVNDLGPTPDWSIAFTPSTINVGGVSALSFNIQNNETSGISGLTFTNTLPAGLTIADSSASNACSGLLDAPAGGTQISLTGGRIAADNSCAVTVNVTGTTANSYVNTTGELVSSGGRTAPATATLEISGSGPSFTQSFTPSTILIGGTSRLSFLIDNTNGSNALFDVEFSNTFPAGMQIANPANFATTCDTSTYSGASGATAFSYGSTTIALATTVAAGASCTVSIDVTATTADVLTNVSGDMNHTVTSPFFSKVSAGNSTADLTVTNGGSLLFTKAFADSELSAGDNGSLAFTIRNANRSESASAISFTDDLDAMLTGVVATNTPLNDVCGPGSQLSGTSQLTLTGGSLGGGQECSFDVSFSVPGTAVPGDYTNVTNSVSAQVLGAPVLGNQASANLSILDPATIAPSFSLSVGDGDPTDTVQASFIVTNNASSPLTDGAFTMPYMPPLPDTVGVTFPASNSCGAGSRFVPQVTGGQTILSVFGLSIAASDSCSFALEFALPSDMNAGVYDFHTSQLAANINGTSRTAAAVSGSMTVSKNVNLTLTKSFTPDAIIAGESTSLSFTLDNALNSSHSATAINFSDDLDAMLTGSVASGLPMNDVCGTGSVLSGTSTITLSGAALAPGEDCTFAVTVTPGPVSATQTVTNTTSVVSATVDGSVQSYAAASAELEVSSLDDRALVATKSFSPAEVVPGQAFDLTFTLENPNATATATAATWTENLSTLFPSAPHLIAVGTSSFSGCGASPSFIKVSDQFFLVSAVDILAGQTCTLTVQVSAPAGAPDGTFPLAPNSISYTLNAGSKNVNSGSASLRVATSPVTFTKSFTNNPVAVGENALLTFALENTTGIDATNLNFTDDLDAMLSGATFAGGVSNSCGMAASSAGASTFDSGAIALNAGASCEITIRVAVPSGSVDGNYANTTSDLTGLLNGQAIPAGTSASDTLVVTTTPIAPPVFSKAFTEAAINPGQTTTLTFTIDNSAANAADLSRVSFTDDLDGWISGAVATTLPTAPCGAESTISGTGQLHFMAASIAAGATCTIPVVITVPATTIGQTAINTSSALTDSISTLAPAAQDSLVINSAVDLSVTLSDSPDPVVIGQNLTYTVNLANAGPDAATNVVSTFAPTVANFTVTATSGCAEDPNGSPTCTIGTIAAGGSDSYTITGVVTGSTSGSLAASVSVASDEVELVSANNSAIASTTVTASADLAVTLSDSLTAITAGETLTYTLVASNNGPSVVPNAALTSTFSSDLTCTYTSVAAGGATGNTAAGAGNLNEALALPVNGSVTYTASCSVDIAASGALSSVAQISSSIDDAVAANDSATDSDTIVSAPTPMGFSKAFLPASIAEGETSVLTFTIDNSASTVAASTLAFTDALPSGLIVAATPGVSNTCGGTFAPAAGDGSLTFSGGALAGAASCSVAVTVRAVTDGSKVNTSSTLTSNFPSASPAATDTLTVTPAPAPGFTKVFAPDSINHGETTTLTFTIDNTANAIEATTLAFTDALTGGLQVAATPAATNSCGGTFAPVADATSLSFSGGTVAEGASCQISVALRAMSSGTVNNTTGDLTSSITTAAPATDTLTVAAVAPTFAKAFAPATVVEGETSVLTFTINNAANAIEATTLAFTDNLPAGLIVAPSPNASNTCGATFAPAAGANTITFTGGTLTAGASCTAAVTVRAITDGSKINVTSDLTSSLANAGTASDTLTVTPAPAPGFTKSFNPTAINQGETSVLTFNIDNSSNVIEATGLSFTDSLPAGLEVATTPNISNSCLSVGFTAAAGDSTINYSGGQVAAGASCAVSVTVRALTPGDKNNVSSSLTSSITTAAAANATLSVAAVKPAFSKAFSPATIGQGETSVLTFTLNNSANAIEATNLAFTDTLSGGLVVAPVPAVTTDCNGATFAPTAGATSISFADATLAAGASCTASVTVRGLQPGTVNNTSSALTSSLLPTDPATAALSVTAAGTPAFTKVFGPNSIAQGATSVLTFTIDNSANPIEATSLTFSDPFPSGVTVASVPSASNTCGGTFAPAAGDSTVSLVNGAVAANATCTLAVTVRAITAGTLTNTTGPLSSSLNGVTSAFDDLVVTPANAPGFTTSFAPDAINQGETSTLTISIDNSSNAIEAANLAFTDVFPSGLVIPDTTTVSNSCAGTVNATETSLGLSGGLVEAGLSCEISVTVRGTGTGAVVNTTSDLTSSIATATAASDTLNITAATPGFAKSFAPASINQGETSTLTFSIDNTANAIKATTLAFGDSFPSGMIVADTPNISTTCNGTLTAVAEASTISFSGGDVDANASCSVSVDVRAIIPGSLNNVSDSLTSSLQTAAAANATLEVIAAQAPGFSKAFSPDTINQGELSTLTVTIDNSANAIEATTMAFTDTFPTGMIVADAPLASNSCGGTFAPTAGESTISFSGGTLAEGAMCTVSLSVRAIVDGALLNTSSKLTSSIAAADAASATLTVTPAAAPGFTKAFSDTSINQGQETTLTFTIDNAVNAIQASTLAFTDTFPTGLLVSTTPAVSNTCGGTVTATALDSSLTLAGGTVAAGASCQISVAVRAIEDGVLNNITGDLTSSIATASPATASLTVAPAVAPVFGKSFDPASIAQGQTSVLTFAINNAANAIEADTLAFTDAFPTGMVVADAPSVSNTCGGTFTATAGEASVNLNGALLAETASCSISVTVRALGSGALDNVTSDLTSTLASADPATATLSVTGAAAPVFAKSFDAASLDQGKTTTLTLAIDNSANFIKADNLAVTDPFPSGLVVAGTPGLTNSCGGSVVAAAGGNALSLSGGTVAAGASCEITVLTQALTAGTLTNVTGTLTSTLPEAAAARAAINVNAVPLSLAMAYMPASVEQNHASTLRFTLRNTAVIGATAISLSNSLPANVVVADTPAASNTCSGGVLTAAAGSGAITYSGGALAAGASCAISVNVVSAVIGSYPDSSESLSSSLGTSDPASATLTVTRERTSTVTFVQDSDTTGTYGFSSSEPLFTFDLEVNGTSATQGPLRGFPGTYQINATPPTGVALTAISCSDTNSVGDVNAKSLSLVLDAGETVTCTFTAQSSLQKTVDTINRFLTKRANLILSSEPSTGRRIDRLQRGSGNADPLTFSNGDLKSLLPFTADISRGSESYKFSTSLFQARQAAASIQLAHGSTKDAVYVSNYRFDAWFEAQYKKFDNGSEGEGHFAIAYMGADYLISPDLLIGALIQIDDMEDVSSANNSTASGTGWMIGPYMTARLAPNLYFDARVAAGRAENEVSPFNTYTDSFASQRFMAMASLTGDFQRGQINIRPAASLSYFEEEQESYIDTVGTTIPSQKVRLGQLKIGPTFSTQFETDDGMLWAPFLSVDAIYNIGGTSGVTLTNADTPDTDGWRGRIKAGLTLTSEMGNTFSFGATYDGIGRSDYENYGLTFDLSIPLSKPTSQ